MFSQRDPSYDRLFLGKSKLTIHGYGCFLVSIANLYGRHPTELLNVTGGVTSTGLVVSGVLAKYCGGVASSPTKVAPKGWCIAMTDKYKEQGFPTHFFCVNMDTKEQIDPLDFPAQIEPLTYPIVEYRPFTNVKLPPPLTWQQEAEKWARENGVISGGWDAPDAPMSQVRVAAALKNYHDRFNS
jgi:hypothetical protein